MDSCPFHVAFHGAKHVCFLLPDHVVVSGQRRIASLSLLTSRCPSQKNHPHHQAQFQGDSLGFEGITQNHSQIILIAVISYISKVSNLGFP